MGVELTDIAVGKKFTFIDYGEPPEGGELILKAGEVVKILQIKDEPDINGIVVESEDGTRQDCIFETELAFVAATPKMRGKKTPDVEGGLKVAAGKRKASEDAPKVKGAKAPKAPKVKVPAVVEVHEIIDTECLSEMLAEKDALTCATELVEQQGETNFALGGVLAHIMYEGLFREAGYTEKNGFNDYVQQELGLDPRSARYLVKIYERATALGIDEDRINSIGWTKLRVIEPLLDKANMNKYLTYAEKHTRAEIETYVKKSKVSNRATGDVAAAGDKTDKLTLRFVIYGQNSELVTSALDRAQDLCGSEDKNKALMQIITDWSAMTDGVTITLEEEMTRLMHKFGEEVVQTYMDKVTFDAAAPEQVGIEADSEVVPEPIKPPTKAKGGKKKAATVVEE